MPGLPEGPTIDELGHPEANMNSVFGVFAPARTPGGNFSRQVAGREWSRSADIDTMDSHVHFDVSPPAPGH